MGAVAMGSSIEEVIAATVRVAVREEVRTAVREAMADIRPIVSGDYLTPIEAGRIADVHPETIRQWIREGRLPRHMAGREYRVRRDELDAFLAESNHPPPTDPEAIAAAILAKTRGK